MRGSFFAMIIELSGTLATSVCQQVPVTIRTLPYALLFGIIRIIPESPLGLVLAGPLHHHVA